ncbi:MAG TPA: methyltransferase domain-containing protein [Patescibacteria group bacterium]|nr:methyltransferase domain-containing protein [Patescibacteria group bacterium]
MKKFDDTEDRMIEKQLPSAEMYEKALTYWSLRLCHQFVLNKITELAPRNGCLLDMMCGPGKLLGRIARARPDLRLVGVDIDEQYINYGRLTYPQVTFQVGNVLSWSPPTTIDMVICTGALHHVPYDIQEIAISNIGSFIAEGKIAIISDCYIDNFTNETERKIAATKMGAEYLLATIRNGAPDEILDSLVDILWNDLFGMEYKTSLLKRLPIFKRYFSKIQTTKTWPAEETEYGEYTHICFR